MASTYADVKRRRQEERRLKTIAELTHKVASIALQIYALDAETGRPPDRDVVSAVDQALQIMRKQ